MPVPLPILLLMGSAVGAAVSATVYAVLSEPEEPRTTWVLGDMNEAIEALLAATGYASAEDGSAVTKRLGVEGMGARLELLGVSSSAPSAVSVRMRVDTQGIVDDERAPLALAQRVRTHPRLRFDAVHWNLDDTEIFMVGQRRARVHGELRWLLPVLFPGSRESLEFLCTHDRLRLAGLSIDSGGAEFMVHIGRPPLPAALELLPEVLGHLEALAESLVWEEREDLFNALLEGSEPGSAAGKSALELALGEGGEVAERAWAQAIIRAHLDELWVCQAHDPERLRKDLPDEDLVASARELSKGLANREVAPDDPMIAPLMRMLLSRFGWGVFEQGTGRTFEHMALVRVFSAPDGDMQGAEAAVPAVRRILGRASREELWVLVDLLVERQVFALAPGVAAGWMAREASDRMADAGKIHEMLVMCARRDFESIRHPAVEEALIELTHSPNASVRLDAIELMGQLGSALSRRRLESLEATLIQSSQQRRVVEQALLRIRDRMRGDVTVGGLTWVPDVGEQEGKLSLAEGRKGDVELVDEG